MKQTRWPRLVSIVGVALAALVLVPQALAFCGFFVSKADTGLYNTASQVIIARDGKRTVFTMMNDYKGDVKDFARIVPIPVVPRRDQIGVGDPATVSKLDAYSAPRLVEYFDGNPCAPPLLPMPATAQSGAPADRSAAERRANALGVKIEAQYSVGEYDIVILSASQSGGLETYLRGEGYKLPKGAGEMLAGYIKGGMKFFVVKVNLERFARDGAQFLRPVVLAYESEKFMLPIRLGTLNSTGEQDLIVYLLSRTGRIETSNYRTVPVPSDVEVPGFVKGQFASFYRHLFRRAYEREGKNVAFMEYSWNTGGCDPCSAPPPGPEDLRRAGVFWLNEGSGEGVHLTRLHVRYTRARFTQDLFFRETGNQQTFQGRYILRNPYTGPSRCAATAGYEAGLRERGEKQAQTLANLTGWDVAHIRARMGMVASDPVPWWKKAIGSGQ